MIGAKSLVTLTLLALGLLLTVRFGILMPERLLTRDATALFLAGVFGVLVGTLMFRFWRLAEMSRHYFRASTGGAIFENEAHFVGGSAFAVTIGDNSGEAFDLRPRAQHLLCVGMGLLVGLAAI